MRFTHWLRSLRQMFGLPKTVSYRRLPGRLPRAKQFDLERLEDRVVPAGSNFVTSSFFDSAVYEFNSSSGALLQTLVAPNSQATLQGPAGMAVGPDGNLYFSSQFTNSIVEYNFSTQSLSTFINSSVLNSIAGQNGLAADFAPAGLSFGPDANLYVSLNGGQGATSGGAIIRFNITSTGSDQLAYAGTFTPIATGLVQPTELAFGVGADSHSLYVSNSGDSSTAYATTPHDVIKVANADGASPASSVFIATNASQLNYPSGLTWGPDGDLYVTDLGATGSYAGQVVRYNPDGSFNEVFTQPTTSLQYQFPSDAVFDANGNLLTANLGLTYPVDFGGPGTSGSITEFNSDGTFNQVLTGSTFPADPGTGVTNLSPSQLAVAPPVSLTPSTGLADTINVPYNQTITAVGGAGSVTLAVNITNSIPGLNVPLSGAGSLAITGTPTAAGAETFTVTSTDALGDVATTSYSITVNPAVTLSPSLLAGAPGFAYNQTISAAGGTGTATLSVNVTSTVPGLSVPASGAGSIAIAGTPTATGTETFTVTSTDSLGSVTTSNYSITVDPPLVVASHYDSALYVLDSVTGALVATLNAPTNSTSGTLAQDAGVTVGPDGNVYLSSQANNSVAVYNLASNTLTTFINSSVLEPIAAANGLANFSPAGLRFGPDGDLYVSLNGSQRAASGGAVIRFDITNSDGVLSYAGTYQTVATGLAQPTGLAFGAGANNQNTLYVSNSGGQNVYQILHADSATPTASIFIAKNTTVLNYPSGLVWGSDGNLYVVDLGATNGNGQILQYNSSGVLQEVFSAAGSLTNAFPSDAVFLPNGDLVTANLGLSATWNALKGSLTAFTSTGALITPTLSSTAFSANSTTGVTGTGPTQLALNAGNVAPSAVSAGSPYTVDVGNGLTLSASATDAAGNNLSYTWDVNGDDTFGDATGANPTLTWSQLQALGITAPGSFNVSVEVSDGNGQVVTSAPVTLTIEPALTLSPSTLPADTIDVAYNQSIGFSGGTGRATLTVSPVTNAISGLDISGNGTGTIAITGTPTASGVESFTVTATDAGGATTITYSITVNTGVALTTTTQTVVATSFFDSAVYEFDGNTGALLSTLVAPNSQSVLSGPSGLAVGPDGNLYFASENNGSIVEYNFSTQSLSTFITASQLASVGGPSDPSGLAFGPDGNLYVSLNNGEEAFTGGDVVRFNLSNNNGTLSYAGTNTIVASGLIQPTEATFGINAGDTGNLYVSDDGTDTVVKITGAIGTSPSSNTFVSPGSGGLSYPSGLTWSGGNLYVTDLGATSPYQGQVLAYNADGSFNSVFTHPASSLQFQFPSDALFLPNGDLLTANLGLTYPAAYGGPGTSGSITKFNADGSYDEVLTGSAFVADPASGVTNTSPSQLAFDTTAPASLSTVVLAQDTIGVPYDQTITAGSGTGAITLTVSNIQNAIPGLTIPASGAGSIEITGTPTAAGTETFTVTATDSVGGVTTITYSITVNPTVAISPANLPADTVQIPYNQIITTNAGTGVVSLKVSDVLNPILGLTIPASGTAELVIGGTPTAAGTETFTVTATDALGNATATNYTITINPAITLSPSALPADTVNVPYGQAITASDSEDTFYANQVVSYVPGSIPDASYDNPAAALGSLNPVVGNFGGSNSYLTPFNSAYSSSDLVEVGAGGTLILKLAQTASTDGYTIGVHTGFELLDADYPDGTNSDPASYINSWLRQANVMVSADGVNWGSLGLITFDNPSNIDTGAATDPEGGSAGVGPAADAGRPFLGDLSSFDGEDWQQTLATLNGSAGGTWLNLSGVTDENGNPIAGVNFIEFSVPSNPSVDPNTGNPEIMMVDAVVGINSASTITPSGGTGAVTLAVSNVSNAIPGLIVPTSGVGSLAITGTPTATGTETFTVTATDSVGATTTTDYSITVNPAITLSAPSIPADTISVPYDQTLTALGGTGTVTLAVSGIENAIPGLIVPSSGTGSLALTGTPTAAGTETFTLTATDAVGATTTIDYSVTVNPAVTLSPTSLPGDGFEVAYNQTITATGGTGALTLTVTNIHNPIPGLSVPSSGAGILAISGTPTVAGTETFMVTATDAVGYTTGPVLYSITVSPAGKLTLSPVTLSPGAVGSSYGPIAYSASGGFGAYTFKLAAGSKLPAGLALSPAGFLSGMPTIAGTYSFSIVASDNADAALTGQLQYSMLVTKALAFSPAALPIATVNDPFSMQLKASGGSGNGYVFTASDVPAGLTLSSAGLLNGTPTIATGSPFHFLVTATDSNNVSRSYSYTLSVDPALTVTTNSLPVATVGDRYIKQLTLTGGSGKGYVFTATALPTWLTMSSTGLLSGTPTATAGSLASFTITVTDSARGTSSAGYTLSVDPALVLSPTTLTVVTVGNPFSTQLTAAGGAGAGYTFRGVGVPAWMTVSSNGLLSGTPTTATGSPFRFTVIATDDEGGTISHVYALSVNPAPAISPVTLPVATVGNLFNTQLHASGGSGMGYAFAASSLPAWLTLSSTGLLSGTPTDTTGAPFSFTISLADSNDAIGTRNFVLTVDPAVTITTGSLSVATVGDHFSTQLTASGGLGHGYVFTGAALPAWLTLSRTGLLAGTPPATAGSVSSFTITASDSARGTSSTNFTLTVDPALVLSPTTLTVVTVGNPFSTQLTVAGGSGAGYVFTGLNVPAWMTVSSTGLLSGTPTTATGSPFHFTVVATDSQDGTISHVYSLSVNPAPTILPVTLPVATVNDGFTTQLRASGGSGKGYFFSVSSLPAWLTLSSTGLLTGTPPASAGSSQLSFTVTLTDSNNAVGTRNFLLAIDPALSLNPASLPVATVGDHFSTQLTATGGSNAGFTFRGANLPAGLTLSSAGLLSGTPTVATNTPQLLGTPFTFTVAVTDSKGGSLTRTYLLSVDTALAIVPTALPVATVGNSFSTQLTASGGTGLGYTFSAAGLPAGLTLSSAGLLSGTPTIASGSPFHVTVTAADSIGGTVSRVFTLTVHSAPVIHPSVLPTAAVGHQYSAQLTASGGSGLGYSFAASVPLPAWLTLSRTGRLDGTPPSTAGSPLHLTIEVVDSTGATAIDTITLTVV